MYCGLCPKSPGIGCPSRESSVENRWRWKYHYKDLFYSFKLLCCTFTCSSSHQTLRWLEYNSRCIHWDPFLSAKNRNLSIQWPLNSWRLENKSIGFHIFGEHVATIANMPLSWSPRSDFTLLYFPIQLFLIKIYLYVSVASDVWLFKGARPTSDKEELPIYVYLYLIHTDTKP